MDPVTKICSESSWIYSPGLLGDKHQMTSKVAPALPFYIVNLPVWVNVSRQCLKLNICVNLYLVRTWPTVAKVAAVVNVKKF